MPRKSKNEDIHEESEEEEEEEEELADEPPSIEPYTVLGIEKSATADEIKSAYRKAALKHHPGMRASQRHESSAFRISQISHMTLLIRSTDKAAPHLKDEAHTKFQEVAFAYAVLSDPIRRKRYDTTGSTSESMDADGDFSWSDFYSEQFRDVVTEDAIERFAKSYKNSDEERDDVVKAYEKSRGSWRGIFESVMLSNPLEDEDRFRSYIDAAIASGDVRGFKIYTEESGKDKEKRMKRARLEAETEAGEAEVEAKKVEGKKKAKNDGLGDLAALIQRRQANAGSSFLDNLEAKYKAQEKERKPKGKKGKKRVSDEDEDDEPSEEAFQAAAKKLKTGKAESEGRKSKRAKR
ncbi:putative DnaJ like protein subfamily C member 9 [Cadophora sp. MPI-SDFR-AT-0126]|nr:putative DnaJ like protein subfamily C member 9 [Leotiomycetes sp. MPI-SDFR-AT-0126]